MKKSFLFVSALVLVMVFSLFSVQANGPMDLQSNRSIYAEDQKIIAEKARGQEKINRSLQSYGISLKDSTITPLYRASLYDFAQTGKVDLKPYQIGGGQAYVAEVEKNGNFAGLIHFTVEGNVPDIHIFAPLNRLEDSSDWKVNAPRIEALLKKVQFSSEDIEVKLVFMDGLGYVYDIRGNGQEVLIAAGIKGQNSLIFTPETEGILVVDENLRELAKKEKVELDRRMEKIKNLPKGQNPDTGNSAPAPFIVDNSPYLNENIYTVKRGDSLWKIAARYLGKGSRYGEIKKANGLQSNTIYPGQRLRIR